MHYLKHRGLGRAFLYLSIYLLEPSGPPCASARVPRAAAQL